MVCQLETGTLNFFVEVSLWVTPKAVIGGAVKSGSYRGLGHQLMSLGRANSCH
jgi:hypothetical protein